MYIGRVLLTLLSLLGLGLSGCGNPLGPASSAPATFQPGLETGAPFNLIYSSPVSYTRNSVIASNSPTSSGSTITSYSISPSLPAGLAFDTTTGIISGTPSVITTASTYTVTGTNSSGSTTFPLMLTVNDIVPSISYPGSPFTFTRNSAIANQTPTHSGGAVISCSSSPALPTGLSLSSTCDLSGTPTVASVTSSYTVTATNSGGSTTASISITVNDIAPATLAYAGAPFTFTRNSVITAQTPTSSGGAITSCGSAPTLPTGLSLSSSCVLSGTPTVISGTTSYTITATNSGGSTTASISITVNDIVPVIAYAGTPFTFTRNSAITAQPALNTGGVITGCSILPALPAGLSLSAACTLSGTPTVVSGTTSYTVTATNSGGSGTASISITVNDIAPATLAYAGSPFTFTRSSAITAQTPTSSGGAITSCGSSPALPTGLSLSSACVLTGTPTVVSGSTSYTITATNSGGSTTASISITVNDSAPATLAYAGSPFTFTKDSVITAQTPTSSGGAITSCGSAPALPTGLSLSSACILSGTPTVIQGSTSYTITATNSGGSTTASIAITVNDIAPATLAYAGSPFTFTRSSAITSQTPTSSGGVITSCGSAPALPTGLSLSSACVLSGTPTVISGSTSYTITATNSGGSTTASISITINDIAPATLAYSGSPFTFTRSSAITSQTPTSSGGAITSCGSAPALPTGLSLSSACVLSGTPSVISSSTSYTITATNSGGSTTASISITVNDIAPATLAYSGSPFTFTKDSVITSQTPTSSGGAITSCGSSPALPTGLSLSSACILSGTPTVIQGSTSYTITATNSGGSTTASISITVNDIAPATLAYSGSPFTFTKDSAITSQTPTSSGGVITSCGSAPALPTGLSLSSACVLSGTPTVISGSTSYTITATNSGGSTTASISITVNDIAPSSLAYSGSPFTFTRSSAITSQTPTSSGGAITSCGSSPALPTGLSLSSACVLSGTPSVISSSTSYTITATNSGGSTTASISITVNDIAPSSLAYSGSPFSFAKDIAITNQTPTASGGPITSCGSSPTLPAGLSLSSACVLSGTPTADQGSTSYTITATNSGGSTTASISITVTNNPAPTVASLSRNAGTQGATLTITGTGFLTGLTASIGGVNCTTSTYVSATSATCVIPARATIATLGVTVTNTDTQSGTLASSFTHLMNPFFWLRADTNVQSGGFINTWTDLTINGNSPTGVTTTRPQYTASVAALNNLPALYFNSASSYRLNFSGSGLNIMNNKAGLSYGAALTTANNAQTNQSIWAISTNSAASTRFTAFLNDTNATNQPCGTTGFLSTCGRKIDAGGTFFGCRANSTPANNAAFVASSNMNFTSNSATTGVNGTTTGNTAAGMTMNTAGANSTNVASALVSIGAGMSAGRFLNGYLAEIVFYDTDIGTTNRQALETYLKTRYNIP